MLKTAAEQRKRITEMATKRLEALKALVEKKIEDAVQGGQCTVHIDTIPNTEEEVVAVKEYLKALGYKATHQKGSDCRNESWDYLVVQW